MGPRSEAALRGHAQNTGRCVQLPDRSQAWFRTGNKTFKQNVDEGRLDVQNPSGGGNAPEPQAFTDTVLYRCPLNGQSPIITIGSTQVTLKPEASDFVSIENFPKVPEGSPNPTAPFTLGHFTALYELVDRAFMPVTSAEPPNRKACKDCDVEPIFCPLGGI